MVDWRVSLFYQIVLAFNYSYALVAIVYILTRHALLSTQWLNPGALDCSQYCAALCACMKNKARVTATRRPTASNDLDAEPSVIYHATFAMLLAYLIYVTNALVSIGSEAVFRLLPFNYGAIAIVVSAIIYIIAKSALYIVLVTRLKSAFGGTVMGYSKRVIYALYASVIMFIIVMSALVAQYSSERNGFHYSKREMPLRITMGFLVYDLLFSTAIVYMFNSTLRRSVKSVASTLDARGLAADRNRLPEFHILPMKYTLLSTGAVASTLLSLGMLAASGSAFLMAFDAVINCICVVYMTTPWSPQFVASCAPILRRTANVPCLPCAVPEAQHLINLVYANARANVIQAATTVAPAQARVQAMAQAQMQRQTRAQIQAQTQGVALTALPTQAPALTAAQSSDDSTSVR